MRDASADANPARAASVRIIGSVGSISSVRTVRSRREQAVVRTPTRPGAASARISVQANPLNLRREDAMGAKDTDFPLP
jgi:hypothetical protein